MQRPMLAFGFLNHKTGESLLKKKETVHREGDMCCMYRYAVYWVCESLPGRYVASRHACRRPLLYEPIPRLPPFLYPLQPMYESPASTFRDSSMQ